jgi:Ni/Fe-hydrogenase 1 B-type cytochrome subunit
LRKEVDVAQRTRTYVWEFPVRLTHWVNFLCILTLAATGIYIGSPFIHAYRSDQYIMGTIRLVHFIAGYTFLMSIIIRLYWAFMGNRYASWKVWFPFSKKRRADLADAVKYYTLISKKPPYAVGHTALAGVAYFFVSLLFLLQIFSGFALFSLSHPGHLSHTVLGGWLLSVMNPHAIRIYHHMAMYVLLAFAIVHVYISWWLDTAEKNGLMGSMFGGYKFVSGKEWE